MSAYERIMHRTFRMNKRLLFASLHNDTKYFASSDKEFMINLTVDNVDVLLARAEQGGATHGRKMKEK